MSREFNDIVHGMIPIPSYLNDIIDTPLFQRLSYVTQATLSNKVFINANHTRKEHCIGVSYIAHKYSEKLSLDEKKLRVGALLHDIGHGPYSHGWDKAIYSQIYPNILKGHDEHRKVILYEYKNILEKHNINIKDIFDVWSNDILYNSIIQGPIGCDRMDFLKRDTFYDGTQSYGYYNIDRIISNSSIIDTINGKRLMYSEKVYPDLISSLESRNKMYENVYYHKTSVGLELLLDKAISETQEKLKFIERTKDLQQFKYLTNAILFEMIPLSQNARNVFERKLEFDEEIVWESPIFSSDYSKEFSKFDIYILTKKGPVSFYDYWKNRKESINASEWRIEHIY